MPLAAVAMDLPADVAAVHAGDLDGDGRAELIVVSHAPQRGKPDAATLLVTMPARVRLRAGRPAPLASLLASSGLALLVAASVTTAFSVGHRWVEVIGTQGTYIALGYSQSHDLEGAIRLVGGEPNRVGSAPRRRYLVSVGEWIAPGLRLAVEYARAQDYGRRDGGTGRSTDAVLGMLTFEW